MASFDYTLVARHSCQQCCLDLFRKGTNAVNRASKAVLQKPYFKSRAPIHFARNMIEDEEREPPIHLSAKVESARELVHHAHPSKSCSAARNLQYDAQVAQGAGSHKTHQTQQTLQASVKQQ